MSTTRTVVLEPIEVKQKKHGGFFGSRAKTATAPGGPPKPPYGPRTTTAYDDDDDRSCGCFRRRR